MPLDPITSVCSTVDAVFPLRGAALPPNHKEALFHGLCAMSDLGGWFAESWQIAIGPIDELGGADTGLRLTPTSRLRIRLPADELPLALSLSGRPRAASAGS
jgi:hypothetical protein